MHAEKNWSNLINWFSLRPRITGLLLFLILSIAIVSVSVLRNQILRDEEHDEMQTILSDIHQNIEQSLKNCYTTTVSLALTIDDDGIPQNFDTIGKQLVYSNLIVSAVQLVPHGIIKYIYPLKGNEAAMNLNILDAENLKAEAEKSIETQKIYFAGPLELRQGGIGIVGRLPIYNNNKFWGFAAVIIKLNTLFEVSGINSINKTKYEFQFSKKNPITSKEQFFIPSKTDLSKCYFVSQSINDSDWILYLIAKKPYTIYSSILLSAILGFIIALLVSVLTTKLLKRPKELSLLLKNQETKLLKNEMKFKTIFDQATIGFVIIDAQTGDFIDANNKYCAMLGYTLEEIKEKGVASMTHPDDIEKTVINIKKLNEGEIKEYISEKRTLSKSGKYIWVKLTVSPLWETNEKPTTLIAFIEDITKRKKAEELIIKSQARYKSLIDTIDGIVWEYDLETKSSTFISKKIETILGYTKEEYCESSSFWEDHIHPDDLEFTLALSAKENKNYIDHDLEYRMIAKNGEIVWIRDIMNFVFEDDKPIISRGIMIDITKMKESEIALNNSLELVTEQNKRLLNFSYIVSHNLRSHTCNIESIISLIELAESEEERKELMLLLKTVSISLDETMKHLNEVVNINTNMSLIIKPLNLNLFINKAKEVLNEKIIQSETTFITNVPLDALINYNSAYLESILYNLISNAIRYKHIDRKPIITIKLHKEKDKDVIEISDNGIGIDLVKNGDKIFGMYKTFGNNADARGIGLFITKNQVDAMGGTLTLDSIPNIGSTFKIYT
ncbi:sensor histidine kinase [Flavobacterium cellulosilyticum]|uniref:histidine kinase n=1 Tax=Flavobacterium cellulosilyticum TaxID=2541731 RepID=A0A4R5CM65_9FLAO|nr:PAS domain S-box protein [Flavobacterium cellulosilyticum]TDD98592.1 PAS domain S-box protein [Flavobacterium cellulosilyticum]